MADYIDREALLDRLKEIARCEWNKKTAPVSWSDAYGSFIDEVEQQPAADVAPVVRCKNCQYWHEQIGFCDKHSYFIDSEGMSCSPADSPEWTMWEPYDFCSDSKRKKS